MSSVCQLKDYNFRKLVIEFVPQDNSDEIHVANLSSNFDYDVWRNPENTSEFLMRFWTRFQEETAKKERCGYQVEAEVYGNFTLSDSIEESKWQRLIRLNGVSILLGIIRAQIGMNTGSFIGQKLVIPTIMPQDIVERIEENKKQARKVTKKAAKKKLPAKNTARKKAIKIK